MGHMSEQQVEPPAARLINLFARRGRAIIGFFKGMLSFQQWILYASIA